MSLEPSFLADILEHPDDDTPRLVFADWLDDHGEADRAFPIDSLYLKRAIIDAGLLAGLHEVEPAAPRSLPHPRRRGAGPARGPWRAGIERVQVG